MTNINEPQSSDEFPQGMKFTREDTIDPYAVVETLQEGKESYNDEKFDTRRDNEGNDHG